MSSSIVPPCVFETRTHRSQSSPFQLVSGQYVPGVPLSLSPVVGLQTPGFSIVSGDGNSGPHAYAESTLFTSFYPLLSLFLKSSSLSLSCVCCVSLCK